MAKTKKKVASRKHIRFFPETSSIAFIDTRHTLKKEFRPNLAAVVIDEGYKGCSIVLPETKRLQIGDECLVKLPDFSPMNAEVRWRRVIDTNVIRIGFEFLE